MELEETIIKEIEENQLTWYGHVQRMAEERLPKIALKWMLKQKRAWGRPKKNWMEGIKKATNERNLNEGHWEDRKQWSLGVGQRRKTFWTRYIHTYIIECISWLIKVTDVHKLLFCTHLSLQGSNYVGNCTSLHLNVLSSPTDQPSVTQTTNLAAWCTTRVKEKL